MEADKRRKTTRKLSQEELEQMRRDHDLDEAQKAAESRVKASVRFQQKLKRTAERAIVDLESWADDDFQLETA
jgi:hypothetical protein